MNTSTEAAAIRADIALTRSRLGDTVEALGAQLNPSVLRQRVTDGLHEATIGKVQHFASDTMHRVQESGRGVVSLIRENPLPAAMIAGGIGWLLLKRNSGSTRSSAMSADIGGGASGTTHTLSDAAHSVADTAHSLADSAQTQAQRLTHTAQEQAQRLAHTAQAQAHRLEDTLDENPMALAAVALAVGLAVGSLLPSTGTESRLMGSARDNLLDTAREKISETKEKVQNVVDRAVPEVQAAISEAAREEGLTSNA